MAKGLLDNCFIKQAKFKPVSLNGSEITIRELTIDENIRFRELLTENGHKDAMYYAVKCSMVEPSFFTDKELEKINATGYALINEVFNEIPLIGKSKKEREEYFEKIKNILENQNPSEEDESSKEEEKK